MVSAGLDTVPGNLIMGIAYLSSAHGQQIQQRAREAIKAAYPNNDAWTRCLSEEKVPYVTAFVKEVLRFFTVIPICLPRQSIKPITLSTGVTIPAGTSFYMNAWAADMDDTHFKEPHLFVVERYMSGDVLGGDESGNALEGTPHYSYGAGSRMCAGSHLANRELFTAFLRIFLAFDVTESEDPKDRPILDALECNALPTSLTLDPKPFKCGFKVRDRAQLDRWIQEGDKRTADS